LYGITWQYTLLEEKKIIVQRGGGVLSSSSPSLFPEARKMETWKVES